MRLAVVAALLSACVVAAPAPAQERPGRDTQLTASGRKLDPAGRITRLGNYPTGGALTPGGRFYWAVDAGRGRASVRVVEIASGRIVQTLPIPGGYVGIAFSGDGRRAYVSGLRTDGSSAGQPAELKGRGGDVIHVYDVDVKAGTATERDPLIVPDARDGAAAADNLPPASGVLAWPAGLVVTQHERASGRQLVVALSQADQIALIDTSNGHGRVVNVGRYPYGVELDPRRSRAYVSNERDGSVSVVDLPGGRVLGSIGVGGPRGNAYAHPQGMVVDPLRDKLYVAVTDRDLVAVIDTRTLKLERTIDVQVPGTQLGSAPVSLDVAPDGQTLYVAAAGEDAVIAIALERPPSAARAAAQRRTVYRSRSIRTIGRYLARRAAIRRSRRNRQRRLADARRKLLYGARTRACGGTSRAADRRYARSILTAHERRRRGGSRRRFNSDTRRARARLVAVVRCPAAVAPVAGRTAEPYTVIGRIPTAAYTSDVEVTPDGKRLVWLSAKGFGTGPNSGAEPNIDRLLEGSVGVLDRPTDAGLAALTRRAAQQLVPSNAVAVPPAGTPVVGPGGGPSDKIKYVFYVVRENRTYDQILGSEPGGRGDPRFQVFDDNGVPGPTGGITPNVHALARRFGLLDNVLANTEESTAGHKISAGAYVNDYTWRYINSQRGRVGNPDIFAIGIPPNGFVFDQAARQGVPFRVYGELGAGNQPFADDGRPTFPTVLLNTDPVYPSQLFGTCRPAVPGLDQLPLPVRCVADAGDVGATRGRPAVQSRVRSFASTFSLQLKTASVPRFNYLILFNDHTDGTTPGVYTPKANVADNDLALGQIVEIVSQSPIWSESVIFVIEDDSQSGIDSVDAHRMPALVISPWAKGGVISTRYDQLSFLRTAEMIVGLRPLSLGDALATPLYDAFIAGDARPSVDGTRYRAIQPETSMTAVNPPDAPLAELSRQLPWDRTDFVPQRLADRILWASVFGESSQPPPPGPNTSPLEQARARGALDAIRHGRSARRFLLSAAEDEAMDTKALATAQLYAYGSGLSIDEAHERIEELEGEE